MDNPKIFEAINKIMTDLEPISKSRKNEQQGYMFRGVDDVMNAIAPLMTKYGVFPSIVDTQDIYKDEVVSAKGTRGYHYVRRYTIRFYATDGSFVDVKSDGEAIDYGDKASNKAASVAYREAILKTFVVPFKGDDIENSDHEIVPEKPIVKSIPPKPLAQTSANPQPKLSHEGMVCSSCGTGAVIGRRKSDNAEFLSCPKWKGHRDNGERFEVISKETYEKNKEFFEMSGDGEDVRAGEE